MELGRRFLAGRMAEIFGDFALPVERVIAVLSRPNQRRLRLLRSVCSASAMPPFVRLRVCGSPTTAVLARLQLAVLTLILNSAAKSCPGSFACSATTPEPWRPEDSLTIGKGFAFLLSTALYTRLNFIAIADKLAAQPAKLRSLAAQLSRRRADEYPRDLAAGQRPMWQFASGILAASDWHPAGHGSNSWAVAPDRSTTTARRHALQRSAPTHDSAIDLVFDAFQSRRRRR